MPEDRPREIMLDSKPEVVSAGGEEASIRAVIERKQKQLDDLEDRIARLDPVYHSTLFSAVERLAQAFDEVATTSDETDRGVLWERAAARFYSLKQEVERVEAIASSMESKKAATTFTEGEVDSSAQRLINQVRELKPEVNDIVARITAGETGTICRIYVT